MAARTPAGEKGTDNRIAGDDGWYWVRIVTRAALKREGECQDHCIGDGDYDSLSGAEDLTDDAIWSLRDEAGVSRLTAQVEDCSVTRALGHLNHPVGKNAALQCRHLVSAFHEAGARLTFCHTTRIVLAPDGQTYRRDRVPPDVEAALDKADQARQAVTMADIARMQEYNSGAAAIVSVDTQNGRLCFTLSNGSIQEADLPRRERLEIRSNENPLHPILRHRFQAAVTQPLQVIEPRVGVCTFLWVEAGDFYEITIDGEHVYGAEVSAATAGGTDLITGQDYAVDEGTGLVRFNRDLRDVEILWREKGIRPQRIALGGSRLLSAYRSARDAGDAGHAFDIQCVIGGSSGYPGPGGGARP